MNRNWLNLLVDGLTALTALCLAWTGLLMGFVLPPRTGNPGWLGVGRHAWGEVHFWIAMTLIGLAVIHVALHWTWICTMLCRMTAGERRTWSTVRRRTVGALVLLILVALFIGSLTWAGQHVEPGTERRGNPHSQRVGFAETPDATQRNPRSLNAGSLRSDTPAPDRYRERSRARIRSGGSRSAAGADR